MDSNEVEKAYSPSQWSKRLSANVICQKHVEFIEKESLKVKQIISSDLNIPYGPRPREKIDIFGTDLKNDSPIFIFIHGGYWQEKVITKDMQSFLAKAMYQNKIKTICIGYELCPDVTFEELVGNIEAAAEYCLKYCRRNGSRGMHFAGHSAGAHLVAKIFNNYLQKIPLTDQKLFKSAFLLSGIFDLTPLLKTSYNSALKLDEECAKKASPMFQDFYRSPSSKFYVIAAEYDPPAFRKQAELFHEKLVSLEIDSTHRIIKNVDHFDIIENLSLECFDLTKFIINVINKVNVN
ncbi:unnamed protein product [Brassicogethes aeneus]|uniref:BD-FAE-like domain-containing protein n=1 Tax=Brassicogethes aeneus TaxID=1431903 RepID=A0A9P0B9H2_BRAAE|nr:unnamed protein product [Brassicogethes aeneus]